MNEPMKKILVVEDDDLNREILSDYLAAKGYELVTAATGPEGVERFHQTAPDLMLVDIQLPCKNGFEVCFEVKASRDVPVLLMSAVYTDTAHARPYAERGLKAEGYLVKPFAMTELLDRVQQLIGT